VVFFVEPVTTIMKTILFPTDFSDAATRAFIYALKLADKLDAQIVTLHAFEKPDLRSLSYIPPVAEEVYNTIDLYQFENYRDELPALVNIQQEQGLMHVKVNHTLYEGPAKKVILERAVAEAADLIVLGTTGAHGLKGILLGSVAGEILENATCPVLAVPEQAVFDGKIDHVAFTTTFREEDSKALGFLMALLAPLRPAFHCVNVDLAHTESYNHRMDKFAATFEQQDKISFHVLDGTDFQSLLTDFLVEMEVDIVAMVTEKRNFWQELFHYSKTKSLSYHSLTPILSIPKGMLA